MFLTVFSKARLHLHLNIDACVRNSTAIKLSLKKPKVHKNYLELQTGNKSRLGQKGGFFLTY